MNKLTLGQCAWAVMVAGNPAKTPRVTPWKVLAAARLYIDGKNSFLALIDAGTAITSPAPEVPGALVRGGSGRRHASDHGGRIGNAYISGASTLANLLLEGGTSPVLAQQCKYWGLVFTEVVHAVEVAWRYEVTNTEAYDERRKLLEELSTTCKAVGWDPKAEYVSGKILGWGRKVSSEPHWQTGGEYWWNKWARAGAQLWTSVQEGEIDFEVASGIDAKIEVVYENRYDNEDTQPSLSETVGEGLANKAK